MFKTLARVVVSIVLLVVIKFVPVFAKVEGFARLTLYLVPYLVAGYDVLLEALEGIREREIFDENFLMSIATIVAFYLATIITAATQRLRRS